jgi:hypothetical protein
MDQLQKNLSEGNFSETLVNCLPVQRCYLYWVNPEYKEIGTAAVSNALLKD